LSEQRAATPVRRPDSARPRGDPEVEVEPPSSAELAAIQRHLATLPALEGGTVRELPELDVTLVGGDGHGLDGSYAAMPRWTAETWQARLLAVGDLMRADGVWPSLLWCDRLDRPIGLDRQLAAQGWVRVLGETVMWVGRASVVPHLDPDLRIEAVQPRSIELHERLERLVFGIDAGQAERRRNSLVSGLESGRLRAWVVWLADEPVAVARLSQIDGTAALQGIGVVEGHRGAGMGTLITTVATRAGMALGNRVVWLSVRDDNAPARRVYERLGFSPAFAWSRWLATEGDPSPRHGGPSEPPLR
jgi:ribosomal protein S18 acetylase RimI-like enzyme